MPFLYTAISLGALLWYLTFKQSQRELYTSEKFAIRVFRTSEANYTLGGPFDHRPQYWYLAYTKYTNDYGRSWKPVLTSYKGKTVTRYHRYSQQLDAQGIAKKLAGLEQSEIRIIPNIEKVQAINAYHQTPPNNSLLRNAGR